MVTVESGVVLCCWYVHRVEIWKMKRELREAESNGVRCRWNASAHSDYARAQVWNATLNTWESASDIAQNDHAAVFTALREQPYVEEPDKVLQALLEFFQDVEGNNDTTVLTAAKRVSQDIRPLVLASATVSELVKALEAKKAFKVSGVEYMHVGGPYRHRFMTNPQTVLILPESR